MPADLPAVGSTRAKIRVWEKKVKEVVKRNSQLEENCRAAYALVLGQCTEYLRAKIEATNNYKDINAEQNIVRLLKTVKGLCYKFNDRGFHPYALMNAMKNLYGY